MLDFIAETFAHVFGSGVGATGEWNRMSIAPSERDNKLRLWVDADVWRRVRLHARLSRKHTLSQVVELAIDERLGSWVARRETLEDGHVKGAGEDYPDRGEGRLRTGYPADRERAERSPRTRVTAYIDAELLNRWLDAIYWRGAYLSLETEDALIDYLRTH